MNMTSEKELENLIALQKIGEERIAELKQEIEKQKIFPLNWENCFQKQGYCVDNYSQTTFIKKLSNHECNQIIFRTKKEAYSSLAMSQLSHIIWVANGCEELDWIKTTISKYVLVKRKNIVENEIFGISYHFLAFKTAEIRDKVYEENKQLIHDYLMID